MKTRLTLALALAAAALTPTAAHAATSGWWTKDGATWSEQYITEPDGTVLHADILRPANLPLDARTPAIMTVSPYLNHSGQASAAGTYDPTGQQYSGPSNRFQDFVEGTDLFRKGYAYVLVDLRGAGGSTGCEDWGGPGEQADVKHAVEWVASQPWSTGRVGMYGKSYDGGTGIIGEATQPRGLKAIVSQEPVYDWYDYLYTNGVRFVNSAETPALFDAISETPGQATDSPQYQVNSENFLSNPLCPASNEASQAGDDRHDSPYWQRRNVIAEAAGHTVPIILTQGFLENNTRPLGAFTFFNELRGFHHAWFAMSDHIRGNDVDESGGVGAAPHPWFDQVMRFYNHFVKGLPMRDASANTAADPAVAVETSDGSWRAERQWPPRNSAALSEAIRPGAYTDGFNAADSEDTSGTDTTGAGQWTISPALKAPAHYAGVARAALDVTTTVPNATMSVDVYDIHPDGTALLVSRTAQLLRTAGQQVVHPELYGDDWLFGAGDRIGVLVTSANDGWWTPVPTQSTVTVNKGSLVDLPFQEGAAGPTLSGYKRPTRLDTWLGGAGSITVPAATIAAGTDPGFVMP